MIRILIILILFIVNNKLSWAQVPDILIDSTIYENKDSFSEILVEGRKTFQRNTNTAFIVQFLDSKALERLQACNLAEGLNYQTGLRVETNCQTCNYSQLRMNGLQGSYAQILVNNRPLMSSLTGLYGLELIPSSMIDKIEIRRGSASSLQGSSAIAGTINIITKNPTKNAFELQSTVNLIGLRTIDWIANGTFSIVNQNSNIGLQVFFSKRNRNLYDRNQDEFSEIPSLDQFNLGINLSCKISEKHNFQLNFSHINENRFGGQISNLPLTMLEQAEERNHKINMASLDYNIVLKNEISHIKLFASFQGTERNHYTAVLPDDSLERLQFLSFPPFGNSLSYTFQGGVLWNYKIDLKKWGENMFNLGIEFNHDLIIDEIKTYDYLIDQKTYNVGLFLQSDWIFTSNLSFVSGVRLDYHNFLDHLRLSPRAALVYKFNPLIHLRFGYGMGFRAPQAFDTDMHIAFAGGGISRIFLDAELKPETSHSWSSSFNYDKANENIIYGFTIEGFFTKLLNAFELVNIGIDNKGEIFVKKNGNEATVYGSTLELRLNYKKKFQVESGFTIQKSEYSKAVEYIQGVNPLHSFIRTPNLYGYTSINYKPFKNCEVNINYLLTGPMFIPRFSNPLLSNSDEIITTKSFSDLSVKIQYNLNLKKNNTKVIIYLGVKNMLDEYQNDFDIGKFRDSNFIYGPSLPRTIYLGLKWGSNSIF
jgi:outer membrane receptor for ferrienterochelin and colicins